jgi:hypothetical protein
MTTGPDNETPWGEEQWERFMKESDVRSARYGELLETLIDHPERDEIIAREMGWDREVEVDEDDDWRADLEEAVNDPLTDEELEEYRLERGEVDDIPAYARSFAWASRVFHSLRPEFESLHDELSEVDELLVEALDCRVVAAKIAGGHGMGYDEDSLCGNIVCCKRSLEAADNSLRALAELAERRPELRERIAPLLEEGREVRQLVVDRIEELRSRVWWE